VRQSGGRASTARVLKIEPQEEARATSSSTASSRRRAAGVHPAVDKGVKEALEGGVIAATCRGRQGHDLRRSYHDVDSNEMAFKIAGSMALKDGVRKAKPVLLEPIMKVEVVTPEDYSGDVIGDLNRRRGQIHGMDDGPSGKVIVARCPLRDVRLRDLGALYEPGARDVHHGILEVHGSANNVAEAVLKKAAERSSPVTRHPSLAVFRGKGRG